MRSLYAAVLVLGFAAPALAREGESSWVQNRLAGLDSLLGDIVNLLSTVLLFDFGTGVPLIVAVLLLGGI